MSFLTLRWSLKQTDSCVHTGRTVLGFISELYILVTIFTVKCYTSDRYSWPTSMSSVDIERKLTLMSHFK